MALRFPELADASPTHELAEREHMHEDDRVRASGIIWLALVGLLIVLALIVRAFV